jgi:hypothetical protein
LESDDAKGGVTEYTYDGAHRMLTIEEGRERGPVGFPAVDDCRLIEELSVPSGLPADDWDVFVAQIWKLTIGSETSALPS